MREVQVDLEHLRRALGGVVYGVGGEQIGTLTGVYLEDESSDPEWIEVRTGLLKRRLVPLDHAQVAGERVDVPFERRIVQRTPRVKAHDGLVLPDDEERLFRHYELADEGHHAHALRPLHTS